MRAPPCGPGFAILRCPQANTETTAPGHQIAGEELAQLGVVNDERIPIVGAMAAVKRARLNFGEGLPAIGGVGGTGVESIVIVGVKVHHYGLALIRCAGRHHALAATHVVGGVAVRSVANKDIRRRCWLVNHTARRRPLPTLHDPALNQDLAGTHIVFHHQFRNVDRRAVNAQRSHLSAGWQRLNHKHRQQQCWQRKITEQLISIVPHCLFPSLWLIFEAQTVGSKHAAARPGLEPPLSRNIVRPSRYRPSFSDYPKALIFSLATSSAHRTQPAGKS